MPKPRQDETKDEYISRCVAVVTSEGKSPDQAYAICVAMWNEDKMTAYERAIKKYKEEK